MSAQVKICGLLDEAAVAAAADAGARYAGFVFYRKSPRFIAAQQAAALIARLPDHVVPVGLFVDAGDEEIMRIMRAVPLRAIQLHGCENMRRVAAVKQMTGLAVVKAVGVASAQDIAAARQFESAADMLLLDAKPSEGDLPGGNGAAFDWALLRGVNLFKPWFLAGGLTPANVADAIAIADAPMADVSSGVEDAPGVKNTDKIRAFIAAACK